MAAVMSPPFLNSEIMIDDKFTKEIMTWLDIAEPTDEQIRNGAMLLLKINRNNILYQNICRKPQKFAEKVKYELNKHLRYRLDGMTLSEVRKLDADITPKIQKLIDANEGDTDEAAKKSGKREDHEVLPDDIKSLWEKNTERYIRMKEAMATCQTLEQSCDRYEYLKMLSETYKAYKEDMAKYDEWKPGQESSAGTDAKAISTARAYISKNRPMLEELIKAGDKEESNSLAEKIQQRVDLLLNNNAALSEDLMEWLKQYDFNLPSDEA